MRVLCVGEMLVDLFVGPVDSIDFKNDTLRVDKIKMSGGGDANNNAIDFAKLGNKVTYIGRIGKDSLGDFLIKQAKQAGVNMDYCVRSVTSEQSKSLILINQNGDRTFLQNGGTSEEFCFGDCDLNVLKQIDMMQIGGVFHMPSFDGEGCSRLLKEAKKYKIITSMDVTSDRSGRWRGIIDSSYPYLDYFLPSIEQASMIVGTNEPEKMADFFLEKGVKNVVIKLGEKGSFFKSKKKAFYTGVYDNLRIVETTGCGDAFCAGFLTGVGLKMEPEECMVLGTACSAFVLQEVGATSGLKELKIIKKFIAEREKPLIKYVCNNK